jgi:hypothetical protein
MANNCYTVQLQLGRESLPTNLQKDSNTLENGNACVFSTLTTKYHSEIGIRWGIGLLGGFPFLLIPAFQEKLHILVASFSILFLLQAKL